MTQSEWEAVVGHVGPRLFRYFKFKGAGDLSTDLTQETFLRLLKVESRYSPTVGPLVAFALGVAQNIWREHLRKASPDLSVRHP